MYVGSDEHGNFSFPFFYDDVQIPFDQWRIVSKCVWTSPGPIVLRSVTLTSKGELFVQYIQETKTKTAIEGEVISDEAALDTP